MSDLKFLAVFVGVYICGIAAVALLILWADGVF